MRLNELGVGGGMAQAFESWLAGLAFDERLTLARESLRGVVNVAHFLVGLHETNRIVVRSDALRKQVPRSYAAHAFNTFTQSLFNAELVSICSLWDPAERDAFSIPTVVALIDRADVIECMAREMATVYHDLTSNAVVRGDHSPEHMHLIRQHIEEIARQSWVEEHVRITRVTRNAIE
jgi:hypothetical protein